MLHNVTAESTGLSIILIAWKIHPIEIPRIFFFSQVKNTNGFKNSFICHTKKWQQIAEGYHKKLLGHV